VLHGGHAPPTGERDLPLNSATAISQERLQLQSPAFSVCGAFDAAFAKLLWPLVEIDGQQGTKR